MQARLERELELAFLERVFRELSVDSIKLNLAGNRGWPDRMFLLPLRPAYIEFKRPGEKPYKLQQYRIAEMKVLKYDVIWTDDYEYAYTWLSDLLTSRLSKTGYTVNDWASMRRVAIRSRIGQD